MLRKTRKYWKFMCCKFTKVNILSGSFWRPAIHNKWIAYKIIKGEQLIFIKNVDEKCTDNNRFKGMF